MNTCHVAFRRNIIFCHWLFRIQESIFNWIYQSSTANILNFAKIYELLLPSVIKIEDGSHKKQQKMFVRCQHELEKQNYEWNSSKSNKFSRSKNDNNNRQKKYLKILISKAPSRASKCFLMAVQVVVYNSSVRANEPQIWRTRV